jgi:hypothetical protein
MLKRLHEFEETEKVRTKQKLEDYDKKCARRLNELRELHVNLETELEEIHVSFLKFLIKPLLFSKARPT